MLWPWVRRFAAGVLCFPLGDGSDKAQAVETNTQITPRKPFELLGNRPRDTRRRLHAGETCALWQLGRSELPGSQRGHRAGNGAPLVLHLASPPPRANPCRGHLPPRQGPPRSCARHCGLHTPAHVPTEPETLRPPEPPALSPSFLRPSEPWVLAASSLCPLILPLTLSLLQTLLRRIASNSNNNINLPRLLH